MSLTPVRPRGRRQALVAVAAIAGALAATLPVAGLTPAGTVQATGLQQIAFETNPSPGLVTLGDLASRSDRKPVTKAGLGPFTMSGVDSLTGQPYSFVTDADYDPNNEAAYANEGDEGIVSTQFDNGIVTVPVDAVDSNRTNVLQLWSDTNCENNNVLSGVDGFCTLYGPEVWSEPFDATVGQSVSFDWRATGASDDYEIYAFLVAVTETSPGTFDYGSEASHELLAYGRGDTQGWTTTSSPVAAAGSYRFRFVNGSYDGSGGLALGSEMYIDSVVRVGQSNPITFPQPGDKILGAGPFQLGATSPAGPVTYTSSTPSICTVSGDTVTLEAGQLGVCTIVADQAGDGTTYVPASSVARSFTVLAAATAPTNYGLPIINGTPAAGQILSATEGTWGDGGSPITGTTVQWQLFDGADTTDIPGATDGFCYLVASPGNSVQVTVTKTNAIGSTPATSARIDDFTCGTLPTTTANLDLGITPGAPTGSPDAQANGSGSGLQPSSSYSITLEPLGTVLDSGSVLGDGTFGSTVTVPSGLPVGSYEIRLTGVALDGSPISDSIWFTVVAGDVIGDVSDVGPIDMGNGDGGFIGVTPARVLDTRDGGGQVAAGTVREITVVGLNGIPADSGAVVLNVAVSGPAGPGFLTVFPCGSTMPEASNLNYGTGQTIANAVTVEVGVDGKVCVYTSTATDLVVDITGGYSVTEGTGLLQGLTPARLFDSRDAGERVPAGTVHEVVVSGQGGVAADATSVVLSVTATEPLADGYVTVFPCGGETPLASNVNYVTGGTVANAVYSAIGTDGKVCFYTSAATHLVVDVNGDYAPGREAGSMESATIERLVDTRLPAGPTAGAKVAAGQTIEVTVVGHAGVTVGSTAVTLNVAVVDPDSIGFLTVFPCGGDLPLASNVNFAAGQTVSNAVTTAIGTDGKVCVYTLATAHIVVDANASYGAVV